MFKKVLFIFLSFLILENVKALNYKGEILKGEIIPNIYIKKEKNGSHRREYAQFLVRSSDNKFVYCIEPWVKINNDNPYQIVDNNMFLNLNISEEKYERISLYAYYGYGYRDHNDKGWYFASQYLIWKEIDPETNIYFTDQLIGGNVIHPYDNYINELKGLVSKHYIKPSFNGQTIKINLGEDLNLIDTNNVLDNYTINSKYINVQKDRNNIKITNLKEGNYQIDLIKLNNYYNEDNKLYTNPSSQNVMVVGNYKDIKASFNIEVTSGKIIINKLDDETKTNEKVDGYSLKGALYELIKDGEVIDTFETDEEGVITTYNLPLGKYIIKEKKASFGYELDLNEYELELKNNNEVIKLDIYEKRIKNDIGDMPITSGYDNKIYLLLIICLILIRDLLYEKI